jgi:hypothetical protein
MRLLDRYVLLLFIRVFLVALLTFAVLLVAIDFFGRLGYFLDTDRVDGTFAEDYSDASSSSSMWSIPVPPAGAPFVTLGGLTTVAHMLHGNEVSPWSRQGRAPRLLPYPSSSRASASPSAIAFQQIVVPALSSGRCGDGFFSTERAGVRIRHVRGSKGM